MSNLSFGSATDVGRVRSKNQDNLSVLRAAELAGRADGLFIVADGMGGHAGGEVASRVTVETVPAVVRDQIAGLNGGITTAGMLDALRRGMSAANEAVWKQGRANPALRGMGTTCVAIMVRDGRAAVGNVGDSRAYMLRAGRLIQLTSDHSLVQEHVSAGSLTAEEARGSRFRNVITRGIGIASSVEPDVEALELEDGDALLLCSDGLTNMLREGEIERVLRSSAEPQEACDRLVQSANANGGVDNITAVVVHHGEFAPDLEAEPAAPETTIEDDASGPKTLPIARQPAPWLAIVSAVAAGLAAALIYVGAETYETTGSFPFVHHKPASKPVQAAAAAPPDFSRLVYAPAAVVFRGPLRSSPLVADPAGGVYAVEAATGRTLRIAANGARSGEVPGLTCPKGDDGPAHYAADQQGNLYASIRSLHTIQKFDSKGARVGEIGRKELKAPGAVAVNASGDVYVVDGGVLKAFRPAVAGSSPHPGPASAPLSVENSGGSR